MNTRGQMFGGPWTEHKLECVSKYLHAYTKIMTQRKFNFMYIDAFAGTGYRKLKNDEETGISRFLAGSARRALEVKPPFKHYVFIETDKDSFAALKKLAHDFPHIPNDCIKFVNSGAKDYLTNLCQKTDWDWNRALAFLDPYGMQVEWATIESIAKTEAIDLWLLFPIGSVNRLLENRGEIHSARRRRLDLVFGSPDWYDEFYQLEQQIPLFSEEERFEKRNHIFDEIERYFIERLRGVFASVANNPLPLRNSKNSLMYLLCFAAGNPNAPKALEIAQDILEQMRATTQLTFQI